MQRWHQLGHHRTLERALEELLGDVLELPRLEAPGPLRPVTCEVLYLPFLKRSLDIPI